MKTWHMGPDRRKGTTPFYHLLNDITFSCTTWHLWVQERRALHQFPKAAVTKYHQLGSLKEWKCIVLQSRRD